MGRADEGIASLRDAIQRDASNHLLVLELADLLADAQQFREAEAEYRRVLTGQPENGRALTGLGIVLAATGRFDAALEPLTRAVERDARDEEARLARAEVLAGLGRIDEARTEFEHLARSAARPDIREAAGKAAASAPLRRR
jgi:Flp pilus assembly protein TadD